MIDAADLFCGAGGTSRGLVMAADELRIPLDLLAVNHWHTAVRTHEINHPDARHLCADLSTVDPNEAVPKGKLSLLIASPECTHHSRARGGKPCSNQSRASAWHVVHWTERLMPEEILVENVTEFEKWGPLTPNGRPDKAQAGQTFKAWVESLRSFGYVVEWRSLNAADFGDATSRKRLFVRASRSGKVRWPEPTHAGQWRGAKEIIDWDLKGASIFDRKRPLAPKTLERIEVGLRKFGGEAFIAVLRGTGERQRGSYATSIDDPLGTISAGGVHAALCEPFVIGQQSGAAPRGVDDPLPTIAGAGAIALCQPFIVQYQGGDRRKSMRVHSVSKPLPTQPTENRFALCEPFITKYNGKGGGAKTVDEPLDTITSRDRFALIEPRRMDILFRMLQPHELAAAMGLDEYKFVGTKTQVVKQIGNAVSRRTAQALCREMLRAVALKGGNS